jgi:antitoxin MazE
MRAELVRIGNSRGVRIPKPLIEQCRLGDIVELRVEQDRLVIAPNRPPRGGWEQAFRGAGTSELDEVLLDPLGANLFDRDEWQW